MKITTRILKAALLLGLFMLPVAHAQNTANAWPNKTIRIVVGFPAGSVTDTMARLMAEQLSKSLNQSVIVENKPGANGVIGVGEVARANPDGYTLLVTNSSSIVINPQLYKQITYKSSDFAPIMMMIEAPFVLTVNPEWAKKNSINSPKDLIAYSKRNPDKLSYGSAGQGNIAHLSFVSWSNRTEVKTTHVPYKSAAQAETATMSGELDALFDTLSGLPHMQSGKLKALAVTAPKRIEQLPNVPTMAESGYDNFDVLFWMGLLAPAGTPAPIVQKIYEAAKNITNDPKAMAVLKSNGDPVLLNPTQFAQRIQKEVPMWGEVISREKLVLE